MSCAEYPQMPACQACAWNHPTLRTFRINTKKHGSDLHMHLMTSSSKLCWVSEGWGLTQARHSPCNHPNQTLLLLPCTIRPSQFSVNFETAQFNSDHPTTRIRKFLLSVRPSVRTYVFVSQKIIPDNSHYRHYWR